MPVTEAMSAELRAILSNSLERERQLGRVYRLQMQAVASPRLRPVWEAGWTLKRAHEETLLPLVSSSDRSAAHETGVSPTMPSAREVLSWAYDQERFLAVQYREGVRLADDQDAQKALVRLEDDQRRFFDRIRVAYRDYSTA
jgi:hypothetical protein